MDLPTLRKHLGEANRHIARADAHIARQFEIITEIESRGHSTALAFDLLAAYLALQSNNKNHRAAIEALLYR
jgi:hypothetical protein